MRVEIQGPGATGDQVLQIKQGGTSAITNEQALINLGAVSPNQINVPGGVVGYNFGTKKIDPSLIPALPGGVNTVTIQGPQSVVLGNSVILKITNYDSFTDYFVTFKKFTGVIEGDTILLTAAEVGPGQVIVNGSVFPINIVFSNPVIVGETVFKKETASITTDIVSNSDMSYLLVARKTKDFRGSANGGEVEFYRRFGLSDLESIYKISPENFDTAINYSGEGTKKFTVNNQVTEVTNVGSVSFPGAGNILLQGTGATISSGGVLQQGLPAFPNGLPPYIAPTSSQGDPAYPNGLPLYVAPTAAQGDPSYPNGLPVYSAGASAQGNPSFPNGLPAYVAPSAVRGDPSYPNGLPAYVAGGNGTGVCYWPATYLTAGDITLKIIVTSATYTDYIQNTGVIFTCTGYFDENHVIGTFGGTLNSPVRMKNTGGGSVNFTINLQYFDKIGTEFSSQFGNGYWLQQSGYVFDMNSNTPSSFQSQPTYANVGSLQLSFGAGSGNPSYPQGLPAYAPASSGQGNPSYPNGLPVYSPATTAQGNPSFPNGLPVYKAATPGQGVMAYPNGLPPYVPIVAGQGSATYPNGLPVYKASTLVAAKGDPAYPNGLPVYKAATTGSQQGNPSYPNGLPPYAPAVTVTQQGNPSYPNGLPPYVAAGSQSPQGNPAYPNGLPAYIAPVVQQGNPSYLNGLPPYVAAVTQQGLPAYPNGLEKYTAAAPSYTEYGWRLSTSDTATEEVITRDGFTTNYEFPPTGPNTRPIDVIGNGTSDNQLYVETVVTVAHINTETNPQVVYTIKKIPHRWVSFTIGAVPQKGLPEYPDGLPAYVAPRTGQGNVAYPGGLLTYIAASPGQGNAAYPNGLPVYSAGGGNTVEQGLPQFPDGLPPYIAPVAQKGDLSYPNGLPAYVAAIPASTIFDWSYSASDVAVEYIVKDGTLSEHAVNITPPTTNPAAAIGNGTSPGQTYLEIKVEINAFGTNQQGSPQVQYIITRTTWRWQGTNYPETPQRGLPAYPNGLPVYVAGIPGQGNAAYPNGLPFYVAANSTAQQGLPQYPAGLPVYRSASFTPQIGEPNFPTGLPVYVPGTTSPQQGNPNFPNGLPVYVPASGSPQQGLPAYPNGLPVYVAGNTGQGNPAYPNGLPRYVAGTNTPAKGNPAYPNGLPAYKAATNTPQQGSVNYPNGLPAYSAGVNVTAQGNPSYPNGLPSYVAPINTAAQGNPAYPNGLPPYSAAVVQQGSPNYPNGLPPYVPAKERYTWQVVDSVLQHRDSQQTVDVGKVSFTASSTDSINWRITALSTKSLGNSFSVDKFISLNRDNANTKDLSALLTIVFSPSTPTTESYNTPYYTIRGQYVEQTPTAAVGHPAYPNGLPPYVGGRRAYYSNSASNIAIQVYAPDNTVKTVGAISLSAFSSDSDNWTVDNVAITSGSHPFTISDVRAYRLGTTVVFNWAQIVTWGNNGSNAIWNNATFYSYYTTAGPGTTVGDPAYPSGLPPYQPAVTVAQQGEPAFPNGLPVYRAASYLPPAGDANFPNGLPPYVAAVTSPQQGMSAYPDGLPAYVAASSSAQQGLPQFPDGLPPYIAPTAPGNPGQGNSEYPVGLPPYVAGVPGQTYTDTIVFDSNRFYVSGTTVNQTVYPYKNNFIGQSITLSEQGTFACGASLETTDRLKQGGEVIVIHNNNGTLTAQSITVPIASPHPKFGSSVKLKSDASHLLVSSPGANKALLYRNTNRNFGSPTEVQPFGIQTTARFGEIIETNQDFTKVYIYAPGEGTQGTIYLYSITENTLALQDKITLTGLPENTRLYNKICSVSGGGFLYFNTHNAVTNKYSIVEMQLQGAVWNITKTFVSPTPLAPDFFGQSFDISLNRTVLTIGSPGDTNMKGIVNIWIRENDEWIFYDSVLDDQAQFGDRFGDMVIVSGGGENAVSISRKPTGDALVYLK